MSDVELADQAPEQSVADRIASKFGVEPVQQVQEETVEAESELAEIEWDGQKVKVPPALKDAFMRNEDYTRKTQDLAEQRKTLEHTRELAIQRQLDAAFGEQVSQEHQEINVIDAYLAQAQKQDWGQMSTDQMLRAKLELDNVKERRHALEQSIAAKRGQFKTSFDQKMSELRNQARALAAKSINGFSEQTEKEIRAFAISEGLTEGEVDNVLLDPRSVKVLHKAMLYEKVQQGTVKARESATKADKVLRPGAASDRPVAGAAAKAQFDKAMRDAQSSGEKARVIEARLAGMFRG